MKSQFTFIFVVAYILMSNLAFADQPNVLFIAVDDLRVELGCYGSDYVISPHTDELASRGTQFNRAYCQQTVCNPSRASLLTGMRPDTLRVWDLPTHFRINNPEVVTLPELFKNNGYHSQCVGKIFHNWRQDDWKGDPQSWSVPSVLNYNTHGKDKPLVKGEVPPNLASGVGGIECRDVPDNAYYDGRVAETAVETLRNLSQQEKPFFLGVGFWKPHAPFNAPKQYWDLYEREEVPVPKVVTPPENVPEIALTESRFKHAADSEVLREMHHGHLAAISYQDAQLGKVLDELDSLGLTENTIVVYWSDHGLHLGEHGLTRKTTAFELDAHVPMMISTPTHQPGQKSDSLVELLDLYPTLAELCGLEPPEELEGTSLVPILQNPKVKIRDYALTQTPRPNYLRGSMPQQMGYSLRTEHFRYIEWRNFATGNVEARELYDHQSDPGELVNVAGKQTYAAEVIQFGALLEEVVPTLQNQPDPVKNPQSSLMLNLQETGTDSDEIKYDQIKRLPVKHAMISDVRDHAGNKVHQHAYLAHFAGQFWAMWSDGPGLARKNVTPEQHRNIVPGHDRADTRVSYATSDDGLNWSEVKDLTGPPRRKGFGWIARGFWERDGELLALASHFNAPGYTGKGLSLEAFRWEKANGKWEPHGTVLDDALNNFPPKKLPNGQWMMSRRDHQRQMSVLIGGIKAFNQWEILPMASYEEKRQPEEPYWYTLPDGKNLVGLIRDNTRSGKLLRTYSIDNGRSWSRIVKTNFPDATSKFFVLRTSRDYYVMVSNSNPQKRDPLTLAVSKDGLVFTELFYLVGGRHVDYPHIIEHDEELLIAFSGAKQTMEVLKVSLDELDHEIKE